MYARCLPLRHRAAEQRDEADEGRLEASGSIIVGTAIVNQGKVVRPSQLIARVRPTWGRRVNALSLRRTASRA